jgi:glycosyltransferase involved in cell wall biosynthesis
MPISEVLPIYSAVIPMMNEEANVPALLDELCQVLEPLGLYEVIVVDDGSTDRTWEVLGEARTRHPALRRVRLGRNCGQSAALSAGLARVRGQIVMTMDGDLQNDPCDIPKLLEQLDGGADVCLTWRSNRQDSAFRRWQAKVGNGFRNRLLGSDIRDTGSQLRAFRVECLQGLPQFVGMHRFMGNIFLMAGCKVVQIPTNHRSRRAGKTKYGFGNRAWRGLCDVLGVRWLRMRHIQAPVASEDH